mmetsp:Transcript_33211/g.67940  ORF Transcript_33211/g.67940 Transcript_33211/m.67940 type:complete len:289 (-) Transcript_33211:434-1300(-)
MNFDLPFDILRGISQKDCRIGIATRHFTLGSLKGREKFGMNERGFAQEGMMFRNQFVCDVTCEAEVGVLVDGAWDETSEGGGCIVGFGGLVFLRLVEHVGERAPEGRSRLNGRKGYFSDIGTGIESKDSIDLIHCNRLPNADDVWIHSPDIIQVRKQKGLFGYETTGDDIFGIFHREFGKVIEIVSRSIRIGSGSVAGVVVGVCSLEEEFFVVRHLNYEGTLECLLEPCSEEERDQVSQVHCLRGGSSSGVKVEWAWFVGFRRCYVHGSVVGFAAIFRGRRYSVPIFQ